MTKFFPKVFITGIVLFLLLGAGYGITQAARAIPWDCSDWQAFAHSDRTTSILESLAENRGKTLYCGVDQSDTFTKAETWDAGKDRNERDDTVYFGERGQFRGFIAAQEGYLTDGESGVTGVSIDRIFEFPREERRRVKRVKRFDIANTANNTDGASCGQLGGLICSGRADSGTYGPGSQNSATIRARGNLIGIGASTDQDVNWQTQERFRRSNGGATRTPNGSISPSTAQWTAMAEAAATAACRDRGARYAAGSAAFGPGHNENNGGARNTANWVGDNLGIFISGNLAGGHNHRYEAWQSRTWTATCKKTIRRTRK